MAQSEKALYYNALKDFGIQFPKHYREFTTAELKNAYDHMQAELNQSEQPEKGDPQAAAFFGYGQSDMADQEFAALPPVHKVKDPNEMPAQRLNTRDEWEPIRTDEDGKVWYQEEVLKPAYPKPRGRRVLKYEDPGVVKKTVKSGDYTETFEVAGDGTNLEVGEVKITLPSYQVGIYADPRFPFRVVTYNGNNGFKLEDVQNFYGGAELVPAAVKRIYVENTLAYDVRSVIQAIQHEYRQQQLAVKIPQ